MPRYAAGTVVDDERDFYLERAADGVLYRHLRNNRSCRCIGPPRLGKSSILLRTRKRLAAEGLKAVYVSLKGVTEAEPDRWLGAFFDEVRSREGLPEGGEESRRGTWHARLRRFIQEEVLRAPDDRLVLLIDEVNRLSHKPFASEFLSALGALLDGDELKGRFCFCVAGTLDSCDILDDVRDPLGFVERVELDDFTRKELDPLQKGMPGDDVTRRRWLDAIYAWTEGHPYLTQYFCEKVVEGEAEEGGTPEARIKALARATLGHERERHVVLELIQQGFDAFESEADRLAMLDVYGALLAGRVIEPRRDDPVHRRLRTVGLVRTEHRYPEPSQLVVRNRLVRECYDERWVRQQVARLDRPYAFNVHQWDLGRRRRDLLPTGLSLKKRIEWFERRDDLTTAERDYLVACQRKARREQLVAVVAGYGGTLVFALVALAVYGQLQRIQERNRGLLEQQRRIDRILRNSSTLTVESDAIGRQLAALDAEYARSVGHAAIDPDRLRSAFVETSHKLHETLRACGGSLGRSIENERAANTARARVSERAARCEIDLATAATERATLQSRLSGCDDARAACADTLERCTLDLTAAREQLDRAFPPPANRSIAPR